MTIALAAAAQDLREPANKVEYEPDALLFKKVEDYEVSDNNHQVITNKWKANWFVLANAGVNAFWGDKTDGSFGSRLSPQFNFGFGKWFVPAFGVKLQMTGFRSQADKYVQGQFTHGSATYYDKEGRPYWKERHKWWDINLNLMLNITRLIYGFEGYNSSHLKNQLIFSLGIGAVHSYDLGGPGKQNEWAGHIELQYSRFLNKSKALSIDLTARCMLYDTWFDQVLYHQQFDVNASINIGFTYYFKERGWNKTSKRYTYYYQDNMDQVNALRLQVDSLRHQQPDTVYIKGEGSRVVTFPYLVNFVIDRVEVANRERVNLRWVAEMMKETPDQKYVISGYADKYTGSPQRNMWLAIHRAENVYKVLTEEFGVPKDQLLLADYGGVDNMFYDDKQVSRSAIITRYEGQPLNTFKGQEPDYKE